MAKKCREIVDLIAVKIKSDKERTRDKIGKISEEVVVKDADGDEST